MALGHSPARGGILHPDFLGHPAKNDCSTEVLLDFCTRATFLRSVPALRMAMRNGLVLSFSLFFLIHGQTPRTKRMSTKHTNSSFLKQEQRTTTIAWLCERYAVRGGNRL